MNSQKNAQLITALDFQTAGEALAIASALRGAVPWMKVGLELFTAEGPPVLSQLKDMGFKVFLDLKFHDIPNTVKGAAKSAAKLGADMLTLHHAGGERMALAALEGAREAGRPVLVFAVTVLTSSSPGEAGFSCAEQVTEAVAAKAREARAWGLPGIVCSGHEAAAVKAACGQDFLCLCPGIRLAGASHDDQSRVMTPGEAVAAGADFLVVGRGIAKAADPREAANAVFAAIRAGR